VGLHGSCTVRPTGMYYGIVQCSRVQGAEGGSAPCRVLGARSDVENGVHLQSGEIRRKIGRNDDRINSLVSGMTVFSVTCSESDWECRGWKNTGGRARVTRENSLNAQALQGLLCHDVVTTEVRIWH
jgi:hypothetical protein